MTVVVIDNLDSFTFNLVHYVEIAGRNAGIDLKVVVRRNKEPLVALRGLAPHGLLVSPGPGSPETAGVSKEAILYFADRIPVLGVCLGEQCMAEAWGARVVRSAFPTHGKTSRIRHDGEGVFRGIKSPLVATRYHSLIVEPSDLPDSITVTATTDQDEIMGIRVKDTFCEGIQFHPESILTTAGQKMIDNFVRRVVEESQN